MHAPITLLFLLCAAPLTAQQVALDEDFSAGVPPIGWTHVNNNMNGASVGWIPDGAGRAWHEDEAGVGQTDNTLISPPMDLSGMTEAFLHFEAQVQYAAYLANHPNSVGNGVSTMEITTDGGTSWTIIWTDTSQNDGSYSPTTSLTPWAGQTGVQLGMHFAGDFAQEWWIDRVIVDDQPVPVLSQIINPNNGHPYFLLGQSDFATAQSMALSLGGSLASIDSAAESNWVKTTFGNFGGTQRDLMIGLHDQNIEGNFEWISGEAVTYTKWASGEPNNGGSGEDFVHIKGNGDWNDFDGNGSYGVVEISKPRILSTPLIAGQLATITVNGLLLGAEIVLVFSPNGNGPTTTPFGVLEVDLDIITPRFPSIGGQFNFSTYIPSSLAGSTLYGQGVQFNADSTTELSEPFSAPIQ